MIPPQEYILLENVEGYTVDHLVNAILEGHIDAYFEWPKAKQHVPMDFKGKLSRYVRIIQPVFKDGDDKLIFSKVAVLSSEGDIVSELSLRVPHALIDDIRIKAKDLAAGQPVDNVSQHGPETAEELCVRLKLECKTDKEIAQSLKKAFPDILPSRIGRLLPAHPGAHVTSDAYRKRGERLLK